MLSLFKQKYFQLLSALILGGVIGGFAHSYIGTELLDGLVNNIFQPIGQIFLRLIFMVVVPLLFSALLLGVNELGKAKGLGKIAIRTLGMTLIASAASVIIGVTLVNIIKPGEGFNLQNTHIEIPQDQIQTLKSFSEKAKSVKDIVIDLFTKNPVDSAARALEGEIVAFMIFALLFGIGLSLTVKEDSIVLRFFDETMNACMKMVEMAMSIAPIAVFALVFQSAYKFGFGVFSSLMLYVGTVLLGLLIQQFGVYSLFLKMFSKMGPLEFFKNTREVLLYAFSTASSNATLPRSLEVAENKLKLPPFISRFVLTIGSTANQNGTALFEGVTILFLAQVYGVNLGLSEQIRVILISILAGVGTAGIPGGSLPPMMILLNSVGVPAEGVGIILGVDRFLDMARTTINVSGDLVIAACVSGKKS